MMKKGSAEIRVVKAPIKTYKWSKPSRYPVFLPGWRGALYPYTREDKLLHIPENIEYTQVILENDYIQVIVLPELGGHLWRAFDKVSGEEIFYNNQTVKVGLIAMRGAWWASGIEWNFPRGHSVSTVSPVDYAVSENADGSVSVAVGDIDRISRMKWMVRITVRPRRTGFEIDTVLSNPTAYPHRYMYWENCAMHANEGFQYVSPARSAWTWGGARKFPVDNGVDQSWYKAHPHAVDFFTLGKGQDHFGYFDHSRGFGAVHVADSRIMPGKKFFTWGTAEHGRIWAKNLSDNDGPYIELQCGLTYTQAEYRFFPPQQSIRWVETWYPVGDLGPFAYANHEAALHLSDMLQEKPHPEEMEIALVTRENITGADLEATAGGERVLSDSNLRFRAGKPRRWKVRVPKKAGEITVRLSRDGEEILRYSTREYRKIKDVPVAHLLRRVEPTEDSSAGTFVKAAEEAARQLDFGQALEHAEKALEKKPGDAQALYWKGNILFCQFRYDAARRALEKVPPQSGRYAEALELLAEIARYQGRLEDAGAIAGKLESIKGGAPPAAPIAGKAAMMEGDFRRAAQHLRKAWKSKKSAPELAALYIVALRLCGRKDEAVEAGRKVLEVDPLNYLALNELEILGEDAGRDGVLGGREDSYIELASYYEDAGRFEEAAAVLEHFRTHICPGVPSPMVFYHLGWCNENIGRPAEGDGFFDAAAKGDPDNVFAYRREDIEALGAAVDHNADDALAWYLLGNVYAWRFRYDEAMESWKKAAAKGLGNYPVLLRNMGRIKLRIFDDAAAARKFYKRAINAAPCDEDLYVEADEAFARSRRIAERIRLLERGAGEMPESQKVHKLLARGYYFAGRYDDAIKTLMSMSFDRWEGDRLVYQVYENSWVEKGKQLLRSREYGDAVAAFEKSMEYPENFKIGKPAYPRHAPQLFLAGVAYENAGEPEKARDAWRQGAEEIHRGWDGRVCVESYYKGLCLAKIGREGQARSIWRAMTKGPGRKIWGDDYENFIKGLGYLGLEKWAEAVEHLKKAHEADRTNSRYKYHLDCARKKRQAGM